MFKERALKFQEEKDEMVEIINKGIYKFNNINNKRVENIYEDVDYLSGYDTPVSYVCGEKGIGIYWFENVGRCGSTDYEKEYQLIPYSYFEEDEDLDKINEDIQKRKNQELRLSEARREKQQANSKRLDLEKEIRELSQVSSKYGFDTRQKISEAKTNLVKAKAEIENKERKIKEIKNEL